MMMTGNDSRGFATELRAAVTPRALALVILVLVLQAGFILSYVGAFHSPSPHRVTLALVAPAQVSEQVVQQLNGIEGGPLQVTAFPDESSARASMAEGTTSAALVVNAAGNNDSLLVATAGGSSTVTAVEEILQRAEATQQRTITVTDILPVQSGDSRGLSGFYLVIGWTVGGYLLAALLGVANGPRPKSIHRAAIRLLAAVPYAILSGLMGALIVGPVLGALNGHFAALWLLGSAVVFAASAVTMAFQALFGVLGIGITVLVFVVLGNPSAGGAYAPELLPPFWRTIGPYIPNGAATAIVRKVMYFGSHGIGGNVAVIAIYAVLGIVGALAGTRLRRS